MYTLTYRPILYYNENLLELHVLEYESIPEDEDSLTIDAHYVILVINKPIPKRITNLKIQAHYDIDFQCDERVFHDGIVELFIDYMSNANPGKNERLMKEISESSVVKFGYYSFSHPFETKYFPKTIEHISSYFERCYEKYGDTDKIKYVSGDTRVTELRCLHHVERVLDYTKVDNDRFWLMKVKFAKFLCYSKTSFELFMNSIIKSCPLLEDIIINIVDDGDPFINRSFVFDFSGRANINRVSIYYSNEWTEFGNGEPLKKEIVFVSNSRFPRNLKSLVYSSQTENIDDNVLNELPVSLQELSLTSNKFDLDLSRFVNIKKLSITFPLENACLIKIYPPHLEDLTIYGVSLIVNDLPDTIKKLHVQSKWHCNIITLPSRLIELKINACSFDLHSDFVFPETLTHLTIPFYECSIPYFQRIPLGLEYLNITFIWSDTLHILQFLKNFTKLHTFKFRPLTVKPHDMCAFELPSSLRVLHISKDYNLDIPNFIEEIFYY